MGVTDTQCPLLRPTASSAKRWANCLATAPTPRTNGHSLAVTPIPRETLAAWPEGHTEHCPTSPRLIGSQRCPYHHGNGGTSIDPGLWDNGHARLAHRYVAATGRAGPEAMSRIEAAEAFERATGSPMKRNHVPRPALRIGSFVLRPFRPVLASIMGQALSSDDHASSATDEPMRAIGIQPRPASRYIEMLVAGAPDADAAP